MRHTPPSLVFEKTFPQGIWKTFDTCPTGKKGSFFSVEQVHGKRVIQGREGCQREKADGLLGNYRQSLAIVTADCLPIILLGKKRYAMVHAGWQGLQKGVLTHSLLEELDPWEIFVGPGIHWENYQVGEEFKGFFPPRALVEKKGKLYMSLQKEASAQITETFPSARLSICPLCTFATPRFHSFRREGSGHGGKNWHLFFPQL